MEPPHRKSFLPFGFDFRKRKYNPLNWKKKIINRPWIWFLSDTMSNWTLISCYYWGALHNCYNLQNNYHKINIDYHISKEAFHFVVWINHIFPERMISDEVLMSGWTGRPPANSSENNVSDKQMKNIKFLWWNAVLYAIFTIINEIYWTNQWVR